MAFTEILQIKPQLDPSDLNNMERSLSSRFGKIAKTFGKGLGAALAGGGLIGIGVGLVDKILNPLKETQEAIDKMLKASDDIVTNAKQFNTTPGTLARLQARGASQGLEAGELNVLIEKFQTAVAQAKADPTKETSVRQFVGKTDTAQAFFEFIQSLQKLTKDQQVLVQGEVFGEKQILRMSDFLNSDFTAQTKQLGGPTAEQLTPGLQKLGDLNDLKDLLGAKRGLNEILSQSKLINAGMVQAQDAAAKLEDQRLNNQIKGYQDLAAVSNAATEITNLVKDGLLGLTSLVVKVTDLANNVRAMKESRPVKGFLKMIGMGE